jgi:hypothetical protein
MTYNCQLELLIHSLTSRKTASFKFELLCRSFSGLDGDFDSIMKIGLRVGIVSVDPRFIIRNNRQKSSCASACCRRSL